MLNDSHPGFMFVLPWDDLGIGGVNEAVINLWNQIEQNGQFRPILLAGSWEHRKPVRKHLNGRPTIVWRLRTPWGPKALLGFLTYLPFSIAQSRHLLRHENVAVMTFVYPTLNALGFVILRLLRLYRGKIFLHFQGTDIKFACASRGIERLLWRALLSSVDRCVAVSQRMRTQVLTLCPGASVTIVYNGVDLNKFRTQIERNRSFEAQLSQAPYILNVGEFIPRKGQDILINAFARVVKEFPNMRLVLVGKSGAFLGTLLEMIGHHGLTDKVLIFRDVPHAQIAIFFEKAELFVLPSRGEGFAIALLEAAAFALPIIATDVDGAADLILHGENGRLVPSENASKLSDEILDLLRSPDTARRTGKRNHEIVSDRFEWSHAYRAYTKLIGR
jgi:glycosyltransferase involved in cell wall biosynthesis